MKPIYKSLVAATAAASLIAVASVAVSSRQRATTAATTATSTTVSAERPGRVLPPSPTTTLLASPTHLVITANAGTQAARTLSVAYTGTGGFLHVIQDSTALAPNPTVTPLGNGRFSVTVRTSDVIPEGAYRGTLRLRLCAETPCANVLASASVPYRVTLKWANVAEWETFQRDAGHTGHVPIVVNPARIAKKWEWRRTALPVTAGINAVVTEPGRVFVSGITYFGTTPTLHALNEADGSQIWKHDFGNVEELNPPAVSNGQVYIATTGGHDAFLWSFDSSDGAPKWHSRFDDWHWVLAPTVKNGKVYTNGGGAGGGVYAFDANDGTSLWSRFSGDDDMTTPALDDRYAYFYDGTALQVYEVGNGNTVASIADPYMPGQGFFYFAAPMLGSSDNIIAFSGGAYSNRSASDAEQFESRGLVNFSLNNYAARWRTAKTYKTHPAVANGVIYAGSNNPRSFDAIDEASGQVLWSWSPGTLDTTEFHRNVVVTKNVAFVSTELATYAIDLATHKPMWSWPVPGVVAISGSGTLYIVEGYKESTGRLLAFSLH